MALLKGCKRVFVMLDCGLELLYVLRSTLTKRSLRLSIALLAFFGGRIDLLKVSVWTATDKSVTWLTGLRPPLRFWGCAGSCEASATASGSGVDSIELGVPSRTASILLAAAMSSSAILLSPICRYPPERAARRQLELAIRPR